MMPEWVVTEAQAGARIDQVLAGWMGGSRGEAQRLIEGGHARVNGSPTKANYRVRTGDHVEAVPPPAVPVEVMAEALPIDVRYEDEDVLVVNKARGMVVHPAPGAWTGTLVNAVLAHADDLAGVGGELRPGIVHRLDKDTSGLLVIAKNDVALQSLQAQIQAKTAERRYQALLWGVPTFSEATVEAPIGRHPTDRKKMAVLTDPAMRAREALTVLTVRRSLGAFSYVEARLQTGRTHQIRVHCAYIGHPVVGDPVYGGLRRVPSQGITPSARASVEEAIRALEGQALHARSLAFDHPRTGERLAFDAPMPAVMQSLLDTLSVVYVTEPG